MDRPSGSAGFPGIDVGVARVPWDRRWRGRRSAGLTLAWQAFHGFDVGVVFCPLIDVGVAILATGTQITRNLATRTSIPRKASHANVDLEKRRHANANPKERDTWSPAKAAVRECQKQELRPQVLGLARFLSKNVNHVSITVRPFIKWEYPSSRNVCQGTEAISLRLRATLTSAR